jgi:pimeloyl-ACP methyl ester carboxylesterase
VPDFCDSRIPTQLDRLEAYLADSESRHGDIRRHCEKKIIWHQNRPEQRALALVYIHGFSASRRETWPLCDRLAEAISANLFYTRLSGHGRDGDALAGATATDWLTDGLEAMAIGRRLGRQVVVVAMSTGATLATWLATQPSVAPHLHSLVLLSPNFFPKNPLAALALWPPGLRFLEKFYGGWRCFTVANAEQTRYWTSRYPVRAIATMMQLVRLSWRIDLKAAAMPVLMMLNPWDRVINVSVAMTRYRSFPSPCKKLVLFRQNRDLGRHVLAGDVMTPQSTDQVLAIIQEFISGCRLSETGSDPSGSTGTPIPQEERPNRRKGRRRPK